MKISPVWQQIYSNEAVIYNIWLRKLRFFFLLPDWTEITFLSYKGKFDDGILLNFPKLWNFNIQQPSDISWQWRTSWNYNCSSSQSMVRKCNGDPHCNMSKIVTNTTNVHVTDMIICVFIYIFKNVYLVNKEFEYHFGWFNFKKHEWRTFCLNKNALYVQQCFDPSEWQICGKFPPWDFNKSKTSQFLP